MSCPMDLCNLSNGSLLLEYRKPFRMFKMVMFYLWSVNGLLQGNYYSSQIVNRNLVSIALCGARNITLTIYIYHHFIVWQRFWEPARLRIAFCPCVCVCILSDTYASWVYILFIQILGSQSIGYYLLLVHPFARQSVRWGPSIWNLEWLAIQDRYVQFVLNLDIDFQKFINFACMV